MVSYGVAGHGTVWQAISRKSERSVIMVYQWKKAAHIKTDAQTAGEVCEQLESTIGLSAVNLLDVSRAADAPLHNEFEWDDETAAEEYRLQQARHIINCLCIKTEGAEKAAEPVRAFFKVEKAELYDSLNVILRSEDKHAALLRAAAAELAAFQRKYNALAELQPLWEIIEQISA